ANTTLYGTHSRPSFGPYAQDSIPLTEQETIEGHAVRATLYLTGVASAAAVDGNQDYIDAAKRLWDNMAGRRMYVTGGVGAISFDEKFGDDYYLPSDAYLETCAAVGAGFFSQRLNELTGDAKYMDEYERELYNGVLTGISLSGDNYTYQNPLNSTSHSRWEWHGCPCCPPMFLKFMGAMPGFIYSHKGDDLYVNLFAGSSATMPADGTEVKLTQTTNYPWQSLVTVEVDPEKDADFALNLRVPGWARSQENPHGLYNSYTPGQIAIAVNKEEIPVTMQDGYARIERKWQKGDVVEMVLPITPRFIVADNAVEELKDQVAIAVGPLVYCLEGCDNDNLAKLSIDTAQPLKFAEILTDLDNATSLTGTAVKADGSETTFTAIPYYLLGNRTKGAPYKVWMPAKK
ncbi:MAG: glycoside hydrolase family 127 protein, partial [Muribaculaceae bacterium]|nr:glycoside hydrolase family 127 protein [Muribaculaceae bacterium]